jgi:L-threonylcarbamoyladenylate synthase
MIENVTGLRLNAEGPSVRVSGSLESHYSPRATVILDEEPTPGDGMIALGFIPTPSGVVRIAAPETTLEYANQLYAALRKADELGLERVVALSPDADEISVAIVDRLKRASFSSDHRPAKSD